MEWLKACVVFSGGIWRDALWDLEQTRTFLHWLAQIQQGQGTQKWPHVLLKDEFLSCLGAFALGVECSFPRSVQDWLPLDLQFSTSVSSLKRPSLKWSLLHPPVTVHHIPAFMSFMHIPIFVVKLLSGVWFFVTAWTAARQASLSFTISWSLLKFMSIELMRLSNHLMLCCPLLLLPSYSKCFLFFFFFYWCIYLLNVCFPHWNVSSRG